MSRHHSIAILFCFTMQNVNETVQSAAELWPKNRFSTWRPSAILNLKIFIFGHVAVLSFRMCKCALNLIKIGSGGGRNQPCQLLSKSVQGLHPQRGFTPPEGVEICITPLTWCIAVQRVSTDVLHCDTGSLLCDTTREMEYSICVDTTVQ